MAPPTHNNTPIKKTSVFNGLLKKAGIEISSQLEANLSEDQINELRELTVTLQQSIEKNDKTQVDIETKEKSLAANLAESLKQRNKLEADNKEIASLRKEIELKTSELFNKEAEILKFESELVEREANAQAGFAVERKASLEKFKNSVVDVQNQLDKLEEDKLSLEMTTITNQRKQKVEFEKQLQQQLNEEVELLNKERTRLDNIRKEIESEQQQLTKLKLQYNLDQENQKRAAQDLRNELTNKFKFNEEQLTQEIENLTSNRKRDLEKFKLLQQKIHGYQELEHEVTLRQFSHPSDVLAHLDDVEQQLREARGKLKGRSESDLEEELEYFRDLAEERSDTLDELQQDYQEVRNKVAKNKISVREKLELQKQNDVLELHNKALETSIKSLESTLDDLIAKQQSQQAFSELVKMDRKYSQPSAASSITSLDEFTRDIQHRIATAEEGVILYYDLKDIQKFVAGLAMSQLHVFEGISGTGKTSLVKAFAKAVGGHVTTVPVQAGWRDRDDLIGHYNAFEKRYYEKECLQGIYRALTPGFRNRFNIILLDEMNLSRPEQYFAEFLSALEMTEGDRNIVLMDSSVTNPPMNFVEDRKIPLATNTWFMGTANHDETTFEFADKTHDRSFMMELKRQQKPAGWKPKRVSLDSIDIVSVQKLFKEAENKYYKEVADLLTKLKESEFSKLLEKDFKIGWGSRFEVQAHRFISTYIACGGKAIEALEHLLITRVLRKGKVIGRFDVQSSKLETLNDALMNLLNNECDNAYEILLSESELKAEAAY